MDAHSSTSVQLPPFSSGHQYWQHRNDLVVKREQMYSEQPPQPKAESDDSMPSTSDFVKKLYKMLEDQSFQHVVSWGPQGDCFVVKDMNEFTKSILPRMFKHSNFASFVRQLNKYDFHKVKNSDDNQFGEHSWTFKHPDFHADRRDALENIKRKVPASRKSLPSSSTTRPLNTSPGPSSAGYYPPSPAVPQNVATTYQVSDLQSQIDRLSQSQEQLRAHINNLERNYHDVLVEMVGFQRNMAQQDGLMQNLIQYFLSMEGGSGNARQRLLQASLPPNQQILPGPSSTQNTAPPSSSPQTQTFQTPPLTGYPDAETDSNPFLPSAQTQRMLRRSSASYPDGEIDQSTVAMASLVQLNEISRRAEDAGMSFGNVLTQNNAGVGNAMLRPSSRIWSAATSAGLINPDGSFVDPPPTSAPPAPPASITATSRIEALQQIAQLQRNRPSSRAMMDATATKIAKGLGELQSLRDNMDSGPSGSAPEGSTSDSPSTGSEDEEMVMPSQPNPAASGPPEDISPPAPPPVSPSTELWNPAEDFVLNPSQTTLNHPGLQVYTVGHLLPRSTVEDENGNWSFDPNLLQAGGVLPFEGGAQTSFAEAGPSSPSISRPESSQTLRVRRSTYVPGWAVPPRVLLVDDDAVSRKLGSKFLQVFGCSFDVAVDGVSAVNKMNLEKYDLVLMDIVMPKLDGVSATSLIRKFDHMTPIISMTSNSKPSEIMTYYSSGMNDILPKPFTKQGLLDVLEKHLMHLKVIQQMSRGGVPRSLGIPPLSDPSFADALNTQATSLIPSGSGSGMNIGITTPMDYDDVRVNPLAGMGLSDDQYNMILSNIVNGETFANALEASGSSGIKRSLEDADGGRDMKKSRFEEVE